MTHARALTLPAALFAVTVAVLAAEAPSARAEPDRYWCPLGHAGNSQTSQCLGMPGNGYPQVPARSDGSPAETCGPGDVHATVSTAKPGRGYRYWSCDYSVGEGRQTARFKWTELHLP